MKGADCGCGCGGPANSATPCNDQGRKIDTRGRFPTEPEPDVPTRFGRTFDRNYDVQAFTGYPVATNPQAAWARGVLSRAATPVLLLQSLGPVYDPSDPSTWRPGL